MELKVFRDVLPAAGADCTAKAELSLETELLISDYLPPVQRIVKCFAQPVVLQKQLDPVRLTLEGYLRCTVYYQSEEPGTRLLRTEQIFAFEKLAELPAADGRELSDKFDALCAKHDIASDSDAYVLARQGLDTLAMIVDEAARIRPGSVIADLKIARGLDYYTGSVYETFLDGAAALGSICSGGRYDNLASQGNKKYPGVGLSIGLSRLVSYMLHTAGAHANRVSPASVLVAVWNEADRSASNLIANQLRSRGIAADVAPTAAKLGKQIKYADKLGIPYVWFPADASEEGAQDEVKNIITGDQRPADAQSWEPDTVYAQQTVTVEA